MTVIVPGKLMIAGEYAVLEKNQTAVVMAVNRYVKVDVQPSTDHRLELPALGFDHLKWTYKNNKMITEIDHPKLTFIKCAFQTVFEYLGEGNLRLDNPFVLSVESELDEVTTGKKFGLGSSAAVVVGIVKALLQMAGDFPLEVIYKIAACAHFKGQGSGSGADVAASAFGGLIRYTSFHPQWMAEQLKSGTAIKDIIDSPWPYFSCEKLALPADAYLCAGWTKSPAGTAPLLKKMDDFKNSHPEVFKTFLQETAHAVSIFIKGLKSGETDIAIEGLKLNRRALAKLGRHAGIPIETEALTELADIAEAFGGAGKSSGAGGGDCGIALIKGTERMEPLYKAWLEAGIEPLPIL